MKKLLSMALALVMTCCVMTACGSDDSSEKKTTTTEATTTTTTPAAEDEPAADDATGDDATGDDATTTTTAATTTTPAETEAPEPEVTDWPINVGVSYNEPYTATVPDGMSKATVTLVPIHAPSDTEVGWNDYCTMKFVVTQADGTKTYAAVAGGAVNWDTTVDDMGTVDDKTDDVIIKIADCHVMWGDDVSSDIVLDVTGGALIEVVALGWNNDEVTSATPYFIVGDIVYE